MASLEIGRCKKTDLADLEVARYGSGDIVFLANDPAARRVFFKLNQQEVTKLISLIKRTEDRPDPNSDDRRFVRPRLSSIGNNADRETLQGLVSNFEAMEACGLISHEAATDILLSVLVEIRKRLGLS